MEENKTMLQEEESSIDFGRIWAAIMRRRKLYYKVLPVVFVVACIYTLAFPNFYTVTVKLSPELSGGSSSKSGLASLASSFGVNIGGALGNSTEALFPTLYPDLMNSVDFKTSLFPVKVHRVDETETMTYYEYLKDGQKAPWWSEGIKAFMGLFKSEEPDTASTLNPFMLTKEQTAIVKALTEKVSCDVDKKTMVISINVTDQDPLIAATMADSVKTRLQNFITEYRTQKARIDLEYNKKLYAEAKSRYEEARLKYAGYADANQKSFLESVRTKVTDYENEMNLQSQAYSQASAQLMAAEAKVQQDTPAFTTLQSATVPVRKAGPKRAQQVLIFTFLAALAVTVWILYKEDELKPLLGLS